MKGEPMTIWRVTYPAGRTYAAELYDTESAAEARATQLARECAGREVVWHPMEVEA